MIRRGCRVGDGCGDPGGIAGTRSSSPRRLGVRAETLRTSNDARVAVAFDVDADRRRRPAAAVELLVVVAILAGRVVVAAPRRGRSGQAARAMRCAVRSIGAGAAPPSYRRPASGTSSSFAVHDVDGREAAGARDADLAVRERSRGRGDAGRSTRQRRGRRKDGLLAVLVGGEVGGASQIPQRGAGSASRTRDRVVRVELEGGGSGRRPASPLDGERPRRCRRGRGVEGARRRNGAPGRRTTPSGTTSTGTALARNGATRSRRGGSRVANTAIATPGGSPADQAQGSSGGGPGEHRWKE